MFNKETRAFTLENYRELQSASECVSPFIMGEHDDTTSAQVSRSKVSSSSNGKLMRVPKKNQFDSDQVNRIQTPKTSHSKSSHSTKEPAIVSWSTQLCSVNQSSELTLHLRANKEVSENVIVTWSTELATQWSGYENLKGTVTIQKGHDSAQLVINRKTGQVIHNHKMPINL